MQPTVMQPIDQTAPPRHRVGFTSGALGATCVLAGALASLLAGGLAQAAPIAQRERAQLIAQLDDPDLEAAAQAAARLGDAPEAHAALVAALAKAPPAPIAGALVAALARRPAASDAALIVRYARYRNPDVRAAAVTALGRYTDPAAQAAILEGLHDDAPAVRAAAADAAATRKLAAAVDPLIQLVGRGEVPAARALAQLADRAIATRLAGQVGQLPDAALAGVLAALLARPDFGPEAARVEVVDALGRIQDPSALDALTAYAVATPKSRDSRTAADKAIAARRGGGGK